MKKIHLLLLVCFYCTLAIAQPPQVKSTNTFAIGKESFLLNGKPFVIRCGEMHFARVPREYWQHRLQMAKAMGLNTVCAYLFWNVHEPKPNEFNWNDMADAAAFCKLAQEAGLYVILRPGPYSCAEWEFGGFPWWLLKKKDIKLRTQDPYYLERCKIYLKEVGRVLAPLQITNGGNIIMTQVENEYGSYGNDKEYIGKIRDYLVEAGFTIPLFTCDGPSQLKSDVRDDIFSVVNFGGNPEESFKYLRNIRAEGPLMCGEFYPGWFDSWGTKHHMGATGGVVKDIKYMLDHKASFSIYMAHGGTSFGLWSGANCPPFLPQTSSYDYDAPISEAGWTTDKFYALRKLFGQYLQEGETLPEVPAANPMITIAPFKTTEVAPLFSNLPASINSVQIKNMEEFDQGYGAILYRTKLTADAKNVDLNIKEVHDLAYIFINGKKMATLDRRRNESVCKLASIKNGDVLDILVEAMGRVNYGGHLHDRKGITQGVNIVDANGKSKSVENWQVFPIELNNNSIPANLKFTSGKTDMPAFHKGTFTISKPGDTYLDVSQWGKGLVWVNGHCLGRFWNIGPTQTMYLPGPWLKEGSNEVVLLDYIGRGKKGLQGLEKPILDSLTEKVENKKHRKEGQTLDISNAQTTYEGSFANGINQQTIKFSSTAEGRFFCIEALNSQNGRPYASIAELYLLDEKGKELPRSKWKIAYADSEELSGEDGKADNVFDLQSTSIWHTEWQGKAPKYPHYLVIDLGSNQKISGFKYLPRQDADNGRIKDYKIYITNTKFKGL
ncbi:beta-galactosidase [Pinibacter aurantiacus]|uniref:Beta-galactosidase n=1 Tax=Pinibacter aurantiacus TaxID=2851599 RepID=A0A9E2SCS9_9BACT|nr:beta-galactosidase [Pinibacter aurantiacus]MBV4360621.1 beta-galactosidase [Pinibacter aurantiacus]